MTGAAEEDGAARRARQEAADWFARLQGNPTETELAEFAAWRADTLNGETYDRLARQWDQSKFLAHSSIGQGRNLGRARVWHRRPAARVAAVAALLLLIVGGTLLLHVGRGPGPAAPVAYASEADALRTVTLPDGSRVTLDRNSVVRVAYARSERVVTLLTGRARFEVAHDAARPFMVRADGGTIVAHGTIFDVELRTALVRIVLLRGSVEVRADQGDESVSTKGRMLAPGQALVLAHGRDPSPPVAADPVDTSWPDAMLSFDGAPLREAVASFNRRNTTKLVLGSRRIGDLRITGAFAANDPMGFAEAAAAMFKLEVRRQPDASVSLQ